MTMYQPEGALMDRTANRRLRERIGITWDILPPRERRYSICQSVDTRLSRKRALSSKD